MSDTQDLGFPSLRLVPRTEIPLTAKDFKTDQEVRWCPGCGDYAILAAVQSFMPELGVKQENIHFLDLPFYETGRVKKKPIGEEDIRITCELLERVKPHQIYAAGDLSDPHGTHRVCLAAILESIKRLATRDWMKDCVVWLYRGAWQEWGPEEIEMAVPLSPDEVKRKRIAG